MFDYDLNQDLIQPNKVIDFHSLLRQSIQLISRWLLKSVINLYYTTNWFQWCATFEEIHGNFKVVDVPG